MADWSLRPHRIPTRTSQQLVRRVVALRWRKRLGPVAIGAQVRFTAPKLVELHGVDVEIAGQFLIAAGDNLDRTGSEAAFAELCGVAPQPASSGRTTGRHRLSRSGDRAVNSALYIVTIARPWPPHRASRPCQLARLRNGFLTQRHQAWIHRCGSL